jgi:hypothetical protein
MIWAIPEFWVIPAFVTGFVIGGALGAWMF